MKLLLSTTSCLFVALILAACSQSEQMPQNKGNDRVKIESMRQIDSGYRSTTLDWQRFLGCWKDKMLRERSKLNDAHAVPLIQLVEPDSAQYVKNIKDLAATEKRLGLKLPISYLHFAALTGGYWFVDAEGDQYLSTDSPPSHFLPVNKIGLFKNIDKVNWPVWDKNRVSIHTPNEIYYKYDSFDSSVQELSRFRDEHLDNLVKIGEFRGGAILLLNPMEVTFDGEFEGWFLAPYIAGAVRTRSFAELMQFLVNRELDDGKNVVTATAKQNGCAGLLKTIANLPAAQ